MCKNLIIPCIDMMDSGQLKKLIKHVFKTMTENDNDGFGYAYLGESGIYSERFVSPSHIRPMLPTIKPRSFLTPLSESSGALSKPIGGLIVHSRMSTNKVSLPATHPFVKDGQALIHNGVVSNVGETVPYPSGNDSEMLFEHWLRGGLERVVTSVRGYYALGILNERTKQLTIVKDSTARMYATYVTKLNSFAFATTPEILAKVSGFFKEESRVFKMTDNTCLTFNASGRLISESKFVPLEREFTAMDAASLGYTPGSYLDDDAAYPSPARGDDTNVVDDGAGIIDGNGRPISYESYLKLSESQQYECTIDGDSRLSMYG